VASDMNYFYNVVVQEDEQSRVESLEPFDEYEEWHLKCAHYVLLTAFSGSCLRLTSVLWPRISSHSADINGDVLSWKSFDCGTFVAINKHFHQSPASDNAELLKEDCGVKEPASSDGTESMSSEIEANKSSVLQETKFQLSSDVISVSKHGSHWKSAELTFIGAETDTRCQRIGHTANVLSVNGRRRIVAVGGFGVAQCGRHRRLSDITAWDLSMATPEMYSVDGTDLLSRMYHATVELGNTAALGNPTLGNSSLVVVGGRHSPTSPAREHVVLVDFSDTLSTNSVACRAVVCSGDIPDPCWRHTVVQAVIDSTSIVLASSLLLQLLAAFITVTECM